MQLSEVDDQSFQVLPWWQIYKIPLILAGVAIFFVITSIIILFKSTQATKPIEFSHESNVDSTASAKVKETALITIDVEGAVVNPGIYHLPFGSRVEEAISVAGGLDIEADNVRISQTINRAAKLTDGAKIYLPKKSDVLGTNVSAQTKSGANDNLDRQSAPININSASLSELDSLPGVGQVTAEKIINNRPYQTIEELVSKKVVGQSVFNKIKDKISL